MFDFDLGEAILITAMVLIFGVAIYCIVDYNRTHDIETSHIIIEAEEMYTEEEWVYDASSGINKCHTEYYISWNKGEERFEVDETVYHKTHIGDRFVLTKQVTREKESGDIVNIEYFYEN